MVSDHRRFGERFQVEALVASGGMGMVFRGRDLLDGQAVALKVLLRQGHSATERFLREAEALAALSHPAIVRYVAHGVTLQGEPYLAMEWLDGESLAERLARGSIGAVAAARLGSRVLQALAVAHGHGIVHRDIKPSNLFLPLADLDQLKLLDFGIVRRAHDDMPVTRPGMTLGTPMYMAPEQQRDGDAVDGRADIFSLGCVLYECVTAQAPRMRAIDAGTAWDAPPGPALPQSLREILGRMLSVEPARRPANAMALSAELALLAQTLATAGPETECVRRETLSHSEHRVAAVVMLSGVCREDLDDQQAAALQEALAGARAESTTDGMTVIAFASEATPIDQATQAARCALRLQAVLPDASLCVGTKRAGSPFLGDVIDRAGHLLGTTPRGTIHIDALTAHLLETRFEIQRLADGAARLLFEKGLREAPRTLMGMEVPCFGREREVETLVGLWDEVCDAPAARAMLMTSAPGGGKSRVRHEFFDRIQRRGKPFELLVGRGDPMRDAAPFALLGPALLAAAGISGGEPEPVQRKRLTAHASRYVPAKDAPRIAAFLGEIAKLPFPDEDLLPLRAARKDPRLMADQTLLCWLEWLEAECDHHPVLLILEDLHWADTPSVNFVDAALRVMPEKPFMVLALGRPEVDRRFPGVWKERSPQRINLGPLLPRWSRQMIEHVVGKIPEDDARWIVDRAQGNPFYLEELLRVVADGGKVGDDSNLPDTVLGTVQARFDIFGADAKLVLRAASIFGQTFRPAGVKALVEEDRRHDVDRWLEILTKREILFSRPTADLREYSFRHALLRQAAYEMLPPSEKRLGHKLAGEFLEQAGERQGIVLADHFDRAEEKPRAIHWLGVAAQQALDADDLVETFARVERAVKLGAAGEELYSLRVIESQARFWHGEYVEAERAAREALGSSDARTKLGALSALFEGLGPQAKYDEIATLYRDPARPAAPEMLNPWLRCVESATAYLAVSGDAEIRVRTLALLEECRERLEPFLIGRTESMRAHIAANQGKPAEQVASFRRAADHYDSIGHRRAACECLVNLAVGLLEVGQLEEAETRMRQVLATAQKLGINYVIGCALQALTNILAYRGSFVEARATGLQALIVTSAQNDRRFHGCAEAYLSVTEYLAGDYARAEQYASASAGTLADVPTTRPFALALLARSLLPQGRRAEALLNARDAYAELERMGLVDDGDATIRLALVECLIATGDRLAASDVLDKATRRILAAAETIDDPAIRQSFLTRIPEHRRILELARELAGSNS